MSDPFSYPRVKPAPGSRTGKIGPNFDHIYTREFQVLFAPGSGASTGPRSAMQLVAGFLGVAIGSPYYTAYESDPYSFLREISAQEDGQEDGCGFTVKLDYGPWEPQDEDPANNPAEIDIDHVQMERIVDVDAATGEAIVNSAGDLFDPPVIADDSRMVLTITRNEYSFDPLLADAVRDTVNEGPARIAGTVYPHRTLKALAPKATRMHSPRIGFYPRVTYQFHVNRDTWTKKLLDAGMQRLDGSGRRDVITTRLGHPVTSPVLLDGEGQPLDPPDGEPVIAAYDIYPAIDFSIFNLADV